ncbi:MAG: hypothetical protein IJW82_06990 [Clostridia bacterium]|nr:hypothetical protein [Clostridia bacterium]
MKKKIIILIVAICLLIAGGVTASIIILGNLNSEKKEIEKNQGQANEALNDYLDILLSEYENALSSDLYGYVFIIEKGEGYVDYLYMVSKIGKLENGKKVDFNPTNVTITDSELNEIKILAPNGQEYSLSSYNQKEVEEFKNNNEIYIFYGGTDKGFYDYEEEKPDNNESEPTESLENIKQRVNNELSFYLNQIKNLSQIDEVDDLQDLCGYVFIVECGDGLVDYMFMVKEDGTLNDGQKINFTMTYVFREVKWEYKVVDQNGNDIDFLAPNQTNHKISDYKLDEIVQKNDLSINVFFGTQEMGFKIYVEDNPEE